MRLLQKYRILNQSEYIEMEREKARSLGPRLSACGHARLATFPLHLSVFPLKQLQNSIFLQFQLYDKDNIWQGRKERK
jgi:hypothetical protein